MATLRTICEHCGAALEASDHYRGKKILCVKCRQPTVVKEVSVEVFEAASQAEVAKETEKAPKPKAVKAKPPRPATAAPVKTRSRCPNCAAKLPPRSVFCTNCGFDFRTNQQVKTAVSITPSTAPSTFEKQPESKKFISPIISIPTTQPEAFQAVSSSEILSAALDIEYVLTETFILTVWSIVWAGLLVSIFASIFMSMMGIGGIFQTSILIASMVKLWMDAHDLSMLDFFKIIIALTVVCLLLTFGVNAIRGVKPLEEGHIPWIVFFILEVLILIILRIIAFYYGRYFAICRRSALRRTFADEGSSMLADLLPGVAIWLIGYGPSLLITFIAFAIAGEQESVPDSMWIFLIAGTAASIVWQIWYVPMAIGAWSVKQVINPTVSIRWSLHTLQNYLCVIAVYGPLVIGSRVASYFISSALVSFAKTFGSVKLLLWLGTWTMTLVLDQYIIVVMCVAVGLVLRGNESELRWRSTLRKNLGI